MRKVCKKTFLSIISLSFLLNGLLVSCNSFIPGLSSNNSQVENIESTNSVPSSNIKSESENANETSIQYQIYIKAKNSGYNGSYEEWLNSIKGDQVEIRVSSNILQWKYSKEDNWINLIDLSLLVGSDGLSAYEIYKKYYPDYTGTEKEWIDSLSKGNTSIGETIPDGLRWEYFSYNGKKSVSISGYSGSSLNLEIPSTIDGYEVKEIRKEFFRDFSYDKLIVPSSVSIIECEIMNYFVNNFYYKGTLEQFNKIKYSLQENVITGFSKHIYYFENDNWKEYISDQLPEAWISSTDFDNSDFNATNCSVSLVPSSTNNGSKSVMEFLNQDIRFIDLRDVSEGYGVGHVQGFESISYFNVIVGNNNQLYSYSDGTFTPRYEESEYILNEMFPKDKPLFLMCQSGARVKQMVQLLSQEGYDISKVYNVGGWNYVKSSQNYAGYSVSIGVGVENGSIEYDFSRLTLISEGYRASNRKTELPSAWESGEEFKPIECSISLVPGSIVDNSDSSKNNADAIAVKEYFNNKDIRFFDLRDVTEGYAEGHVQKFESVSYFKTIVGEGRLYSESTDGVFVPNYAESKEILNSIFPMDKTLFIMCQAGGRAQKFLKLLEQEGYDMSKVYNVGGWKQVITVEKYAGYSVSIGIGSRSSIEYDFSGYTRL